MSNKPTDYKALYLGLADMHVLEVKRLEAKVNDAFRISINTLVGYETLEAELNRLRDELIGSLAIIEGHKS